ncbi:hypothetical protein [Hathewaya massiliensis]|uniref:hypothetical protein n=1 Tax=Hathewaya massiliensis TaxID=1964382 RepID=UPI0011587564|nr:hypothetical protein [Hathewaya massiliensis]
MNKKGIVSFVNNVTRKARVFFPELDNNMTYEIPISRNLGELKVGNIVIVAFWKDNLTDGVIIGVI